MGHNPLAMAVDLGWVALTALVAVLIRDNFVLWEQHLNAATAYTVIAVVTSAIVFAIAGLHRRLWQYTSLSDVLRIAAAVTVALLLAVFISFIASRLEGVARSVPVIQWFLLTTAMIGTRVALRLWHERRRRAASPYSHPHVEHVLIVGVSHLTELFLQSVAEYASKRIDIVGIVSEEPELRGRLLSFHKVLGTPEDLQRVLAQLEVHGVALDRIVVMQPFERLSPPARGALLEVEKATSVRVDWIAEVLGLSVGHRNDGERSEISPRIASQASRFHTDVEEFSTSYAGWKRGFDVLGVVVLSIVLFPLVVAVIALVIIDVGFPIVFWQKRPGKSERPFKLFKFSTMCSAHDDLGNRLSDEKRSSVVGRLLRHTRLDEIPQLYNILIGEMSFVGPRPLLPSDQPTESSARLLVRPGLTGMAQVFGARDMSPEDKNALDIWYVQHASLLLDIKIMVRTPLVMLRGERVDQRAVRTAQKSFERLIANKVDGSSRQLIRERSTADGQAARVVG